MCVHAKLCVQCIVCVDVCVCLYVRVHGHMCVGGCAHICVFCVVFVLRWGYMIGVQEWGVGYGSGVDGLYKVSVQLFSIGMHLPLHFLVRACLMHTL